MKNKITDKWKSSGLLDFLKGKKQENECAIMLENITNLIIIKAGNKPTKKTQFIAGTLIPITRRMYDGGIRSFDSENLYSEYEKFLKNKPKIDRREDDKEAKLCSIFCDRMVKKLMK